MHESQANTQLPRFRTIKECLKAIREIDPQTALTEWYIRQLCKDKRIICYGSGNKSLISLDSLLNYLNRSLDEIKAENNSEE